MKNFININDVFDYNKLLNEALDLKKNEIDIATGKNKTLGLIFFNPSLRTRLSSYKAAHNLGMNVIEMNFNKQGWKLEFNNNVIMNSDKAEHIKEAAINSINSGNTKYTPVDGMVDLKESIIKKFKNENQLEYKSNQIIVSTG